MSKTKLGRPPLPTGAAKASMFCVRLAPDERAAIAKAAEVAGQKVSDWARAALLASAISASAG